MAALDLYKKIAPETPYVGRSHIALAYSYQMNADLNNAEKYYLIGIQELKTALGLKDPEIGFALSNLSEVYYWQKRLSDAEKATRESVSIFEGITPKNTLLGSAYTNLAGYLIAQEKYQEAEPYVVKALKIHTEDLGYNNNISKTSMDNVILVFQKLGKLNELKEIQRSWNLAVTSHRNKIEKAAIESLRSATRDIEILKTEWRATEPKVCTPPGFFLPKTFVKNLYQKAQILAKDPQGERKASPAKFQKKPRKAQTKEKTNPQTKSTKENPNPQKDSDNSP